MLVAMLLVLPGVASAQDALTVSIREAVLDDDGTTTITVSVTGPGVDGDLPAAAISVLEDGTAIEGIEVTPLLDTEDPQPVVVTLLVDTSGSTEGEPIAGAIDAATAFVDAVVPQGVSVGLVTFGDTAQLVVPPTDDAAQVRAGLAGLEAAGETSLYDAVLVAANTAQNFPDAQTSVVVFSDGADTASTATLEGAVAAAQTAGSSVSTVALQTSELDTGALQQLATATGGELFTVDSAASLSGAFESVAQTLVGQFVITYTGQPTDSPDIDLTIAVDVGGVTAEDTAVVSSPRNTVSVGEPRAVGADPTVFTEPVVLWGALILAFVGLFLLLVVLLVPRGDRQVSRTLQRGLRLYSRGGDETPTDAGTRLAQANVTQSAVRLIDRIPKPEGYDEALQLRIDRAGWPLRSSEFTAARIGGGILAAVLFAVLFANVVLGVLIGAVVGIVPGVILGVRVSGRQKKFEEQMPDTLQLIAGALKAGYGILQAIDTVVKESPEPTAAEYNRVLTEARLGLPLEESLEAMAVRVGSADFRWVVVAINIQRRVGGNLAELLETVSETLREREMVRRQITSLSAEGRLSAAILTGLPFVIGGYLFLVNREYLSLLFERTIGQIFLAGAAVLMAVGIFWMRKLIDIDV